MAIKTHPSILQFAKVLTFVAAPLFLCQCETVEPESTEVIRVQGLSHFPDESGKTFVVGEGCEIIGAGGANCTYIVEAGGKMEAHSGNGNRYKIKDGGYFKGFVHPAENCVVEFSQNSTIEQVEAGPGTRFTMVN